MEVLFLVPLLTFLAVGYMVHVLLSSTEKQSLLFTIAFSYIIGISCITLQMLLYVYIHIPFSFFAILSPWGLLLCYLFLSRKLIIRFSAIHNNFDIFDKCLFVGIVLTALFVIFESLLRPLTAFDAWANWFLAGKAFYLSGTIEKSYLLYANNSTPALLSLMISFIYTSIGHIDEQSALLFFTFLYIALLVLFYFVAKNFTNQHLALLFTFLLASTENIIRHAGRYDVGYGDLPLGIFVFASVILLLEMIKKPSAKKIILFNLLLTTSALIKSEGIPLFLILQCIALLLTKKYRSTYFYLPMVSILYLLFWYIFKHIYHVPENPFVTGNVHLSRIGVVFIYMFKELFNVTRWNFLWVGFILSLFYFTKNKYSYILGTICILQLSVYFFIYLMTPVPPMQHIQSSFDRLLLHIAPTDMLLICMVFNNEFYSNKKLVTYMLNLKNTLLNLVVKQDLYRKNR